MVAELAQPDAGHIVAPAALAPRGFVQLPRAVLFHPDLTDGAKVLFGALLSYAWQEASCFPGQARLADDLGVTERTIRNRLRELEGAGVLCVKQRGQGKTNVYLLLCPGGEPEVGERAAPPPPARNGASAQTGNEIPVRTDVDVEPAVRLEPDPPPPPPEPTDQADEEDIDACNPDDAGTAALVALGMPAGEAREWAAQHDQETLQEAVDLTRDRASVNGAGYVRTVLRNWLTIPSPGSRLRQERAAEIEVGERLAAAEQAEHGHWRDLRGRFDALPGPERRRLIEQARASSPLIAQRPPDHPLVIGAAAGLLEAASEGNLNG